MFDDVETVNTAQKPRTSPRQHRGEVRVQTNTFAYFERVFRFHSTARTVHQATALLSVEAAL